MKIAAIITAHNEERTLQRLLPRVLEETFDSGTLERVVVVSSESSDGTDALVRDLAKQDSRLRLLTEPRRRGKCAAINWGLSELPPVDVVVLSSADVLPDRGALARLVEPFQDAGVGMSGGRPVPTNPRDTLFGYAADLLWRVHHRVASRSPKLGEVVAFRGDVKSIPEDLAVDEAALEAHAREQGLRLAYVPEAVIRNRGADNLKEFLSQRRRIAAGHLHLRRQLKYSVSTSGLGTAIGALLPELSLRPRLLCYGIATAALCFWGRLLGAYDFYVARKSHQVWDVAASTKNLEPTQPESNRE